MTWHAIGGDLKRRGYDSYGAYVSHQQAKLSRMRPGKLESYEARYISALLTRLLFDDVEPGAKVVCLGARSGAEVRVFRLLGCAAYGLDLNPGPDNPDVMIGDFHVMPYQSGAVDVAFTNALDHCYNLGLVLEEAHRVLTAKGSFIVEACCGTEEGGTFGSYESFEWCSMDALIRAIQLHGFTLVRREPFEIPWTGDHLVFRKTEAAA